MCIFKTHPPKVEYFALSSLLPLSLLRIPLYNMDYYQDYEMASDRQANRQYANGNPVQSGGNRNPGLGPQGMSNSRPNLPDMQTMNYGDSYQPGNNNGSNYVETLITYAYIQSLECRTKVFKLEAKVEALLHRSPKVRELITNNISNHPSRNNHQTIMKRTTGASIAREDYMHITYWDHTDFSEAEKVRKAKAAEKAPNNADASTKSSDSIAVHLRFLEDENGVQIRKERLNEMQSYLQRGRPVASKKAESKTSSGSRKKMKKEVVPLEPLPNFAFNKQATGNEPNGMTTSNSPASGGSLTSLLNDRNFSFNTLTGNQVNFETMTSGSNPISNDSSTSLLNQLNDYKLQSVSSNAYPTNQVNDTNAQASNGSSPSLPNQLNIYNHATTPGSALTSNRLSTSPSPNNNELRNSSSNQLRNDTPPSVTGAQSIPSGTSPNSTLLLASHLFASVASPPSASTSPPSNGVDLLALRNAIPPGTLSSTTRPERVDNGGLRPRPLSGPPANSTDFDRIFGQPRAHPLSVPFMLNAPLVPQAETPSSKSIDNPSTPSDAGATGPGLNTQVGQGKKQRGKKSAEIQLNPESTAAMDLFASWWITQPGHSRTKTEFTNAWKTLNNEKKEEWKQESKKKRKELKKN
ncbi:hypothetical protein F5887DRAFT_1081639 [Amanita rubescens]|nr:hypothetical protein F5887DRAFT_1081639 [Amanita rubescens]